MSEIEELEGGYRRRRRPAPDTTLDVAPDQGSEQEEGAEVGTLTDVASELHSTYGNQLVGAALSGSDTDGLEGSMAAQLGAAVGGLGAWSQEAAGSNAAMCRAMRHASGGNEEALSAPSNLGTGGSPLPEQVRQRMESAMGHDFSHVRIHTGGGAQKASKDINAHAFTAGSHIYFGSGEFQPGTDKGDRLIAHELTHVIQHDEHRLSLPDADRSVSKPTDPTEVEAYANEKRVLSELQTVDAAIASGVDDVELSPVRTTDEIVGAVAQGAQAQSASTGDGHVHRDLIGSIVDGVMDAADMREDEDRLDAEEELESFMSESYVAKNFHPSTGLGNFDGSYDSEQGVLTVRVGVHFNHVDGTPTPAAQAQWALDNPGTPFPSERYIWAEGEKGLFAANAIAEVVKGWEGQFTFSSTRAHWDALPDVNVQILVEQVPKEDAHYRIVVVKDYEDVGRDHVDVPGTEHSGCEHGHNSDDEDHVGAIFHESGSDGDTVREGMGRPDVDHHSYASDKWDEAAALNPEIVVFGHDEATVGAQEQAALKKFGQVLNAQDMPEVPVTVWGITDQVGSEVYNMDLGQRRAESVAGIINAAGPQSYADPQGWGETDSDDKQPHRRAEISMDLIQTQQTTVVHEFGHIFGLDDEYIDDGRKEGDATDTTSLAEELMPGQEHIGVANQDSIMSIGSKVHPTHYATFLEMLCEMTSTEGTDWQIGSGPGPGVGRVGPAEPAN